MGLLLLMHRIETGGDNLDFLLMAKSIQMGQWGEIVGWPRPAGYALFILSFLGTLGIRLDASSFFSLTSAAIYSLKIAGVGLFALSAVAVYAWGRRVLDNRRWALGLALLFATNQHVAAWSSVIGAEALFILLAFSSLFLWESYAARDEANGRWFLWSFVLTATACMFTKYQGLMVGASFGVWVLFCRLRSKPAWTAGMVLLTFFLFSIGLMLLGNPFCLTHVVASDPYGYGEQVSWFTRLGSALKTYTLAWPDLVAPKVLGGHGILSLAGLRALTTPFSIFVGLVLLVGLASSLRKGVRPSHVFLACFYVLLLLWPDFLFRYLVPMLPFGLWFLIEGLLAITRAIQQRLPSVTRTRLVLPIVVLLLFWGLAANGFAGIKNWRNIVRLWNQPAWDAERYRISREDDFAEYIEGCQWFRDHAEHNAVVFSRKALFAELASSRSCQYYSGYNDPEALWTAMEGRAQHGPTYLLRDTFTPDSTYGKVRERLLTPLLATHAAHLSLVHRFDSGVEIYRVLPQESN